MISLGSRDGRKGMELGSGGGREMEQIELEEGEACSYQEDEEDTIIDPDVALSYIDKKLQNVLGHFQKDFEGGVSAENLGSKFGGYGSFLPTYQRSPGCTQTTHPKTPPKTQTYNTFGFAKSSQPESGHQSSVISTSAHLVKHGPAVINTVTTPLTTAPALNQISKWDVGLGQVEESNIANRSANLPEQTHLKFRIKVGSDNLSTQNNAAIYSGLGLDVSPSSSVEESPTESEGLSRVPQDASDESPSNILQNMTSFPIHGDSLLSPLHEDLFYLIKKEKPLRDNKCGPIPEAVRENFVALVNGPDPVVSEWKLLGQKKTRPVEKNSTSLELKNINGKDFMKSNVFSAIHKEEPSDVYSRQNCYKKGEKCNDMLKVDLNASKGMKTTNTDASSHLKLKPDQKATSKEHIVTTLFAGTEKSSSVGKKKSKGSVTHYPLPEEIPKEAKKSTPAENIISKSDSENLKLQKNCGKASDKYRDFFGDFPLEQEENEVDVMEIPSTGRVKVSKEIGKKRFTSHNGSEEKLGGKQIKQSLTAESPLKDDSNIAPLNVNGPVLNAAPPRAAPTENNDDWVCCDKCEKWRLLPIGTNPESLPEKWLCSMLDWVYGMNRCSVSEDETTKAAISLNQALTSQNQINLHTFSLHPVPNKDKKKYELMEILDTVNQENPAQLPGFKKILQPSVKSISLSEPNQSPRVNELDCQQLQKSSDSAVEKSRSKKKDENRFLEPYSDGGTAKNSKMKINRENELDNRGAFKKIKKEGMQYTSSSNGMPTDIAVKDQSNYSDRSSSRDSRGEVKGKLKVSIKNLRNPVQISLEDRSLNKNKNGSMDIVAKKRKVKEESSENSQQNEKKARAQKSEGEDFIINESNKRSDKRVGTIMDHQVSQHSCEGIDYFTRDLGSSQPTAAATSSSSKVSGSHKSKSKFQEAKDSPVESVSSSPLRISNMDKLAAGRLNHVEKDDLRDDVNFANKGSPRRYSEGENNGGSNRLGSMKKDESVIIPQHGSHESSVLDFQELDMGHFSHSKTNAQVVASPEVTNGHVLNGSADIIGQYAKKSQSPVRYCVEVQRNDDHNRASGSHSRMSGKGSSARSKDNINCSKSHVKHQNSNSIISFQDKPIAYDDKKKDKKKRFQEKCRVDSLKDAKKNAYKRHSEVKLSGESSKKDSHLKHEGFSGPQFKVDGTNKQNLTRDRDADKSPKVSLPEKIKRAEIISNKGGSVPLPLSRRGQAPVSFKENEIGFSSIAASECENEFKGPKHTRKVESENGCEQINSRHDTPNGQRVRDLNSRSPVKKDSISQAANNALKEAKDLKHLADRLKNPGSNHEKSALYFEAALKFLYGASLLESCSGENSKHGDQAMLIFSSTANFCGFCAQEYERSKDMAAAALAYKCMEVAYMRVIYSSHSNASKDRHELHTALRITLPGESPSSSASDVDNLNNVATVDKVSIAKGAYSPEVTGSHVIPARNRPSYVRLLNYAQDVNNAMEASRKSRIAFGAASVSLEGTQHKVIISSIKRALDFTFQDVEGLLHLVRVAMDTMGR